MEKCKSLQDEKALQIIRKKLWEALQFVDQKLDTPFEKAKKTINRCPYCQSSNVKDHSKTPLKRFYCFDCNKTYGLNRQSLYYRRHFRDKIIDLIVEIHTSNKSTAEIIKQLQISLKTYYKWRAEIILIFPQLEAKFTNRRNK